MAAKDRRSDCAIACTLDIMGDRWTLLVVRDLFFKGPLKYGELLQSEEPIQTTTLAERLRRLETAGIVERETYSDRPPRVLYRLTDKGRDLGPVLRAVSDWGLRHVPGTVVMG